jgi:hypothetical protein
MTINLPNPDIRGYINRDGSHTSQINISSTAVGGRRRKYKSMRHKSIKHKSIKYKKSKLRRKHRRTYKSRKNRRQRGGMNSTYMAYSANLNPGPNGILANGPSVGKIIELYK